jgi:transcriptional regulator with XRE-family HTH domain
MADETLGQRVADARKRKGLSQKEFASLMGRSESWVSQVERDVLPVDRLAIRQKLGEVLGISFLDPTGAVPQAAYPTPVHTDLDRLRSALTGHPALRDLFGAGEESATVDDLQCRAGTAWKQALDSSFGPLADVIPQLEQAVRASTGDDRLRLLAMVARSYQAASAGFARQNEADAAWMAADRALRAAEESGDPLAVIASLFRLAHTFMRLRQFDQAKQVALDAIDALDTRMEDSPSADKLSLYGAMHLVVAALAGFDNDRTAARAALDEAERVAELVGEGHNAYDTEFSPTNVQIHRVSIAVDLGDAGEAIDVARQLDARHLSNERRMRVLLDTARAHIQRRQFDEAIVALLQAEATAPEHLRSHTVAHETINELLPREDVDRHDDLLALARRVGAVA